jgi:hypothetical protein
MPKSSYSFDFIEFLYDDEFSKVINNYTESYIFLGTITPELHRDL